MHQGVDMMLYVKYRDMRYDFVNTQTLDRLLAQKSIRMFYRLSEKQWVDVDRDRIRGSGGGYRGPNRRRSDMAPIR